MVCMIGVEVMSELSSRAVLTNGLSSFVITGTWDQALRGPWDTFIDLVAACDPYF